MRRPQDYNKTYSSIYRGIVEDNIDPENLGRCRIRVPSIHGELNYPKHILPWARPIVLSPVSSGKGSVHLPDNGDIVWVFFEGSNRDFPLYLGGTYAKGELPISNDRVDFYIERDSKISYDKLLEEYTIQVGDNKLTLSKDSISVIGDMNIDKDLHIQGNLSVSGDTTLNNLTVNGEFNQ